MTTEPFDIPLLRKTIKALYLELPEAVADDACPRLMEAINALALIQERDEVLAKLTAQVRAHNAELAAQIDTLDSTIAEFNEDKVTACIREIRGDVDDDTLIERLCEMQDFLRHGGQVRANG